MMLLQLFVVLFIIVGKVLEKVVLTFDQSIKIIQEWKKNVRLELAAHNIKTLLTRRKVIETYDW